MRYIFGACDGWLQRTMLSGGDDTFACGADVLVRVGLVSRFPFIVNFFSLFFSLLWNQIRYKWKERVK